MKPHVAVNLVLLVCWPVAWTAPLAHAQLLPFFGGKTITILSGIAVLWEDAVPLALLVALFALVIPLAKTGALVAIHFGRLPLRHLGVIEAVGRLAMADVFLVALYIVMARGVGVGEVTPGWGLWLFTACVLGSIWVAWASGRQR